MSYQDAEKVRQQRGRTGAVNPCARAMRVQKDGREQPTSLCSQNAHDIAVLVRCAREGQSAVPKQMGNRKTLARCMARLDAGWAGKNLPFDLRAVLLLSSGH